MWKESRRRAGLKAFTRHVPLEPPVASGLQPCTPTDMLAMHHALIFVTSDSLHVLTGYRSQIHDSRRYAFYERRTMRYKEQPHAARLGDLDELAPQLGLGNGIEHGCHLVA